MQLGAFSVSLAVKDLQASKEFYTTLGFRVFHGEATQGWLMMQNGTTTIGLFHNMFKGNILTFNSGWNSKAETVKNFTDVRALRAQLAAKGVEIVSESGKGESGPASFTVTDPDGNNILIDQHV